MTQKPSLTISEALATIANGKDVAGAYINSQTQFWTKWGHDPEASPNPMNHPLVIGMTLMLAKSGDEPTSTEERSTFSAASAHDLEEARDLESQISAIQGKYGNRSLVSLQREVIRDIKAHAATLASCKDAISEILNLAQNKLGVWGRSFDGSPYEQITAEIFLDKWTTVQRYTDPSRVEIGGWEVGCDYNAPPQHRINNPKRWIDLKVYREELLALIPENSSSAVQSDTQIPTSIAAPMKKPHNVRKSLFTQKIKRELAKYKENGGNLAIGTKILMPIILKAANLGDSGQRGGSVRNFERILKSLRDV